MLEEATLRGEATVYTEDQDTFFEGFELSLPSILDSLTTNTGAPIQYSQSNIEMYAWFRYEGKIGPVGYDLGIHGDLSMLLKGKPLRHGVQPRFTLSYTFGENWRIKASYGVFTQKLITISNEDDLISLFDAWLFLPEELSPEVSRHYVLGVDGNIFSSLAASLQIYGKAYPSIAIYNVAKIFPKDPDYLSGTGRAYGVEALLRFTSPLLDVYASYAWSRVTLSETYLSYAPRYDRRHSVKAIATLHLFEGFDTSLHWEYGSGYPFTQGAGSYTRLSLSDLGTTSFPGGLGTPMGSLGAKNASRLPAYHRLDVGVSYARSLWMFRTVFEASVINVYDAKNILYYDRTTGKTDYMIPFFPTASLTLEF
jgi:hypothetical protein